MASRSRASSCLFALFIVALLGLALYNTWQVHVLRTEVTDLRKQVEALKKGDDMPVNTAIESIELVMKARKHADLAKKHIADGEFKKARTELDTSLQLMKRFSQTSGEASKDAMEQLRDTWRDAGDSLEKMWQGITEKSGGAKTKGG